MNDSIIPSEKHVLNVYYPNTRTHIIYRVLYCQYDIHILYIILEMLI